MSVKIGLLGYSGSGKTTLSAILAGKRVESFDPLKPAMVAIKLVDVRLKRLAEILKPPKSSPPEITLFDFKGVPKETGFGEKEMAGLLDVDLVLQVVGGFSEGSQPASDLESLQLELIFHDTERLTGLIEKRNAEIKQGRRKDNPLEEGVLEKTRNWLESEKPVRLLHLMSGIFNPPEKVFLFSLGLITTKDMMVLLNGKAEPSGKTGSSEFPGTSQRFSLPTLAWDLPDEASRQEKSSQFWSNILSSAGLITFYTFNEKEVRAWFLRKGGTALEAAGQIHTDIAHGFIRAEVVNYADFERLGSSGACREKGVLRLEGKEYPVADGDLLQVRFSP